ncbi:MAG TPA: sirohydrochlorin nickelochelatase [Methanocorpusculum sp.]|jgi:sirohydrochlorin cobaltochelatase|nr:sirohydrochlorin nickelochelatase [Methanocorpusculum sp.]MEE1135532.1 sirohydrochlorin nickelochelatase [Methanocorpusculum sp.]HJJ62181.1 sirohydrochlorin nickelochelatase [Methanocorpusculum sp.]HJJ63312.1 sirohydrochlorin nickelochelatase [Methanocorpusculum sp.]HJJ67969.1 sirohydrochlorin nickelochelatase [Methanocorpusculum sp.]
MSLTGLLLVGHGSRLEYNKQLITTTAELMKQERPDYLIKSCFLEYSSPTVPEGLDSMRSESISRLVVVPLFLAKGIHVLRDIPRLLGLDTGKKQGSFALLDGTEIPLVYAEPIGIDPLLASLMLKNAAAAEELMEE